MGITIIGIDCAVQDKNVGLALASFDGHEARIEQVPGELKEGSVVKIVANWIKQDPTALLALDAPLGWPVGLRQALRNHKAGKPVRVKPEKVFHRATDEFVRDNIFCVVDNIRKMPLEVGADRIARTAHAALDLLRKLRNETRQQIRLAWKPEDAKSGTWAIEVYPAGTLAAHRFEGRQDYKRKDDHGKKARGSIVEQLEAHHVHGATAFSSLLLEKDDALDAVLCVLAGVDFLQREVYEPEDLKLAKKEGWIWVREVGR